MPLGLFVTIWTQSLFIALLVFKHEPNQTFVVTNYKIPVKVLFINVAKLLQSHRSLIEGN